MIADREGVNRALNAKRKEREQREPEFKQVTARQVQNAVQRMLVNGSTMEIVIQDDRGGNGGFLMKVTPAK